MSGIRNIKKLAKQYKKACIYFHIDLDGITSALAMKTYLKKYGIETVEVRKIQYGSTEYSCYKPSNDDIMAVIVDFSNGKSIAKIHTDHHDRQIEFDNSSKHFRQSPSNAGTISSIISSYDIFTSIDKNIIDMVDSANYLYNNVTFWDVNTSNINKTESIEKTHINLGLAVNKLLLTFKNTPLVFETIVMECEPSMISIYNWIINCIRYNNTRGNYGFPTQIEIDKAANEYFERSLELKSKSNDSNDVISMNRNGQSLIIDNTIIQYNSVPMKKKGAYDRYNAFRICPDIEYFVVIWSGLGLLQVSKNPWNKSSKNDLHLGNLVLKDIYNDKILPYIKNYNISLMALKKNYENEISEKRLEFENNCFGFSYEDFELVFGKNLISFSSNEEKEKVIKCMSFKPSKFIPTNNWSDARKKQSMDMIKFLNSFTIPLSLVIEKLSGGHKAITNLTGLDFLKEQIKIDTALKHNDNPYRIWTKEEKDAYFKLKNESDVGDNIVQKIIKNIAVNVVNNLKQLC